MTKLARGPSVVLAGVAFMALPLMALLLMALLLGTRLPVAEAQPSGPLKLTLVATADIPVGLIADPVTKTRYVVEKTGRLRPMADDGTLGPAALDLSKQLSLGNEQGFLGAAFSNDAAWLYVNFTNRAGDTRIRAYRWANGAAARSGTDLLAIPQPYANHNGGQLVVSADGVLWIGMGDGGSGGDPKNNAQNTRRLLGKILRILPTPTAAKKYRIPTGNIRAVRGSLGAATAAPEVWAFGLRNPWRFSIDQDATVWIGDVGQNAWEEVDAVPVSSVGANFGWRLREGTHAYDDGAKPAAVVEPVYDYAHSSGGCSVTGGFVYRGAAIASLVGTYVFADYCDGKVLGLDAAAPGAATSLGIEVASPTSFGIDADGELYVMSGSGSIYRIEAG